MFTILSEICFNHISHEMTFLVLHLWAKWWSQSFGYRDAMDLATTPCSFHHLERDTIYEGWKILDVKVIVVGPLHYLLLPWSFCVFYCWHVLLCFKHLTYDMAWIWLMSSVARNDASIIMEGVANSTWMVLCWTYVRVKSIAQLVTTLCCHMYMRMLKACLEAPYMRVGMTMLSNNHTFVWDSWKCAWLQYRSNMSTIGCLPMG